MTRTSGHLTPTVQACRPISSAAARTQRWRQQVRSDGSYTLTQDVTRLLLTVTGRSHRVTLS